MADSSLSMIRQVVTDARARLTRLEASLPPGGQVAALVAPAFARVFTSLDGADYAITTGATKAWRLFTSDQRDPAAIQALISEAQAGADAQLTTARDATAQLVAELARLSMPARPTPVDALQEATLTGLKADLRHFFDSRDAADLPSTMIDELQRRLIAGDRLAVWLLASSDWPRLVLTARGLDPKLYDLRVPATVAQGGPDGDTEAARTILRAIEAPNGLAGALVAMTTVVRYRLEDLAAYKWGALDIDLLAAG